MISRIVFFFGMVSLVWISQAEAKEYTCKITTGYGTSVAKGQTPLEAKTAARILCGERLIDMYFRKHDKMDDTRVDDLVLACANIECD